MLKTHFYLTPRLRKGRHMYTFTPHVCLHSMCRETFTLLCQKICRIKNTKLVVTYGFQPFLSLGNSYSLKHAKNLLSLYSVLSHWAEFSCREMQEWGESFHKYLILKTAYPYHWNIRIIRNAFVGYTRMSFRWECTFVIQVRLHDECPGFYKFRKKRPDF
jgi:hypothetical protein